MRDKKLFVSVILLTTVMLFAGGCGNLAAPVSTEPTETAEGTDTEENTTEESTTEENTEESLEESLEPTPAPTVEPEESMESSEAENSSEKETEPSEQESGQDSEYEIISMDETVMYAAANCNIRSGAGTQYDKVGSLSYAQEVTVNGKVEAGEDDLWYVLKTEDGSTQMVSAGMLSETKPAAQASSGNGSGSNSGGSTGDTGNSQSASNSSQNASEPSETAPAVPETTDNIYQCECGFETTDFDVMAQHIIDHMFNEIEIPVPTQAPEHEHTWIAQNNQRWVPQIVTIVDEPEQYEEYYIYRMYWYNTNTWEETRDPSRFEAWSYDMNGAFYSLYHNIEPEDDPLFLGYDEYGHPTSINDHVIIGPMYDYTPAVTHVEDQGYYETYVEYYHCECGAIMFP